MTVAQSTYIKNVKEVHHLSFGSYYFFDNYIISEIHDEVLFNWEKAQEVIQIAEKFYGSDYQPHYIANRIYDYSIVPNDWLKFFKTRYRLKSFLIVSSNKSSVVNFTFEKIFYKGNIRKFHSLKEAIPLINKQ